MVFVLIIVLCVLLFFFLKPYFLKYDTILAFSGGLGAGKTYLSVINARVLLFKNRSKVRIYNMFHKKHRLPIPLLYSNIPVRISKHEWSSILTDDILLLQKRIPEKSVVLIDEIDSFANQFEYRNPNLCRSSDVDGSGAFDEFIRFFRHYTKGGYLVCNTQCSENIVLTVRRRLNKVYNLMDCRFFPNVWFLPRVVYAVKCRNVCVSEEIKTIEDQNLEDEYKTVIGFVPFLKLYDTYCYSDRYLRVPKECPEWWKQYKTNVIMECPDKVKEKLTKG